MGEEDEREEEKLLQLKCCFLLQSPAVQLCSLQLSVAWGAWHWQATKAIAVVSQKTPASEWRYQCSRIGPGLCSYIHMRLQRLCSLASFLSFLLRPPPAGCCRLLPPPHHRQPPPHPTRSESAYASPSSFFCGREQQKGLEQSGTVAKSSCSLLFVPLSALWAPKTSVMLPNRLSVAATNEYVMRF